ncbi:MAG: tetratricopeptide repeat protein [Nitrospiraceae bacterium]|nr:tetratricopeptide repeat protein [Nitrospiraceae bacterium]
MFRLNGRWFWLIVLVVYAAAGLLLYSNVITNGVFLFDDFEYIVGNPLIHDLSFFSNITDPRHIGYLSFALNYALDGEDPYGYHLLNVIIHIVNAFQVFLLTGLLLKLLHFEDERAHLRQLAAFFSGLLFLVHPVETQAVSYITQRFTSLTSLFYLGSILSYLAVRARIEEGKLATREYLIYALGVLSCVLAMKTKEIAFTAPFMIAFLEYLLFPGSGHPSRRFVFLVPFLASLIIIPLALFGPEWGIIAQGSGIDEVTRGDKLYDLYQRSSFDYLINQFGVILTYMRLLVLPIHQLAVYDLKAAYSLFELKVLAPLAFLLCVAGSAVYSWRKAGSASPSDAPVYRLFSVGVLWFFVTLSVESSVIPIKDMIFEHRVYLPSVGFFAIVPAVFFWAGERFLGRGYRPARVVAVMAVIVIILSGLTYRRNFVWVSEVALWDDVVQKTGKAIGYNNRGNAYMKEGKLDLALRDLDKTISFFPNAKDKMAWENSDFTPTNMSKTYMSRGNVYEMLGDSKRAQADFDMARQVMMGQQ